MEVSFKTAEAKQCRDLSPVANFMHNNVHDELARSRAQSGRHDFVVFEGIPFLRWKGADEFAESAPALIPERKQPIHVISRNRSRIGEKLPNLALTHYCPGCEPMTTKDEGKLAFSDDCVRFLEYEN